jgi:hypothetical protein
MDKYLYNPSDKTGDIPFLEEKSINRFSRTIRVFNPRPDIPLHNFWLFIKNAKLFKKNNNRVEIALCNNKELLDCITKLDDKIDNVIEKNFKIVKNHNGTLSVKNKLLHTIKLYIDNDTKAYDENGLEISFDALKIESDISVYIELVSVNINDINASKHWRLEQVKKNILIDRTKSFFAPRHIPHNIPQYTQQMQPPPSAHIGIPNIPHSIPHSIPHNMPRPPSLPTRYIPKKVPKKSQQVHVEKPITVTKSITVFDLLNMKSRLRKTRKDKTKSNETNDVNEDDKFNEISKDIQSKNPIEGLKKVETVERLSLIDLMRHINKMSYTEEDLTRKEQKKILKKYKKNINNW